MAERGQYVLHVECDSDGSEELLLVIHDNDSTGLPDWPRAEFVAATREAALAKARRAGWKFSWKYRRVTCPKCNQEKNRG